MENLAERIRKERKSHGLTQAEFADRLGMSEMTIRRWEADKRSPRMEEIKKIAEALNTSVEYLMGLTDDAPPETPQISLPINNMEKENKISNDDLDLGFWGTVAEKARRVAKSEDYRKPLILSLLNTAVNEFSASGGKPTEKRGANIHADIIDNSGNAK